LVFSREDIRMLLPSIPNPVIKWSPAIATWKIVAIDVGEINLFQSEVQQMKIGVDQN
jgi:hypothetical protein